MKKEIEKPKKPIQPEAKDFPRDGYPIEKSPFIIAYKKYQKDLIKYERDLEIYEQTKLIKLIKNANPKYILKKFKIIKRDFRW